MRNKQLGQIGMAAIGDAFALPPRSSQCSSVSVEVGGKALPHVVEHRDGDDGETLGFHVQWPDGGFVYCGEVPDAKWNEMDGFSRAYLGDVNNAFVFEVGDKRSSKIIGKIVGCDEAREIIELVRHGASPATTKGE